MHSYKFFSSRLVTLLCVVLMCLSMAAAKTGKTPHHSSTSKTVSSKVRSHNGTVTATRGKAGGRNSRNRRGKQVKVARPRGQQSITDDRAREIQQALIRARYLDGEPSGTWDQQSRDAMTRFQNDNGWQSKVVPDSRALIKLGLGPDHAGVMNAETSLMSIPPSRDTARQVQPGEGARN